MPSSVLMNILFVGGLFPKEKENEFLLKSKNGFQSAANVLQWALVDGFEKNHVKSVSIVTVPFLGDFPRDYRDIKVCGGVFSHSVDASDVSVPFCNLKFLNVLSKYVHLRRVLTKYLRSFYCSKEEDLYVVVYGMFAYHLTAVVGVIKRFNRLGKKIKVCLIVPDLPDMMGGDGSRFHIRLYNFINDFFLKRAIAAVDGFVFLTPHMVERVDVCERPWCVVEGVVHGSPVTEGSVELSKFRILYTGTLALRYGIRDLISAFKGIKGDHYELIICGGGEGDSLIRDAAKQDHRIQFLGQLPRVEVLALQMEADVLVNPRASDGEYTRYSFPSKIMEYYASGTPVIMHRLPGIPAEYFDYCFVPSDESVEGLRQAIIDVSASGRAHLREVGRRAREFVLSSKSDVVQCRKIIEMLKKL